MGDFVNEVPDQPFEWGVHATAVSPNSPYAIVEAKFSAAMATAESMLERLVGPTGNSGYLGDMAALIAAFPTVDIGDFSLDIPAINVATDNRPTLELSGLDLNFPAFTAPSPVMASLPTVDMSSIVPANAPESITAAVNWIESAHSSTIFPQLVSYLLDGLSAAEDVINIDLSVNDITIDSENGVESITVDLTPLDAMTVDLTVASNLDLSALDQLSLDSSIEEQIWSRALARQEIENDKAQSEIENYFAARGFDLPPGAMAGRLQEQLNNIARNNVELNEKIMIERVALVLDIAIKNIDFELKRDELLLEDQKTIVARQDLLIRKEDLIARRVQLDQEIRLKKQAILLQKEDVITKRAEIIHDNKIKQQGVILQKEDIITKRLEISQQKKQFIASAVKDLEAVLRDFTNKTNDRNLDYAKAVAVNAIQLFSENVRAYVSTAEAKKAYVEVQVENLRAVIESNKGLIESFSAEAQVYSTVIEAKAKGNEAILSAFDGDVKGYDAQTKAISSNQMAQVEEQKVRVQNAELKLRAAIAEVDANITSRSSEWNLREKIAEAMANIAMQSVASAYGSVNASAGLSYNGSESQSETFSHGETRSMDFNQSQTLGEAHHFEEKKV